MFELLFCLKHNEKWNLIFFHFKNFIKRLNYYLKDQEKREVRYLNVIEFQKRGSVHFHTVFFNLPLIDIQEERKIRHLAKLWRHGFIEIKHAKVREGLTSYLTKYLTKDNMDERLIARSTFVHEGSRKNKSLITKNSLNHYLWNSHLLSRHSKQCLS